ncbi:MAG TPA: ABC transporter permease [Kineosporiaceae bacterium]|nr:ABC transporter permease [Kineosporiaceae bacterium]
MTQLIDAPENIRDAEDTSRQPSSAEVIRLVAGRDISAKLRDKTFIISTVVLLLIVSLSVIVPLVLERNDSRPTFTVAVVGTQAQAAAEAAREAGAEAIRKADAWAEEEDAADPTQAGPAVRDSEAVAPPARLSVRPVTDLAEAERLLRTKDVDAALVPGSGGALSVIGFTELDDDLSRLIALSVQSQNLTTALAASGTDEAEAQRLFNAPLPQRLLDPPPPNEEVTMLLGIAFAGLFLLTSFSFGLMIAQSVVEEKQSRVVELLVAAVPVRLLLFGKVAGSTLLALGQVALLLAVGLAGASVAGQSAAVTLLLHSGGWFLAFFALGFGMLACAWAAAGALTSRQEDLQATTLPMQMLVMIPFFVSVYVTDPGRWMTFLSYFPLSAPLSMPRRLMLGDAAWWEPILSALGVAATGVVLVLLATRLYEGALLRTANRISLRTAWQGSRSAARPEGDTSPV